MDKSLQERLVGAAVLVALGVWLIPWVLDGSAVDQVEESARVPIKLPIPDSTPGNPIRRETIDLRADRGAGIKAAAPQTGIAEAVAARLDPSPAQAEPADAGPDAAEPAAAEPVAAGRPAAVDNEPAATPANTLHLAAETPAQSADEPEPAADILAGSPVSGWMVQIGSFTNPGNARRQAERIGTYGHDARIYEFSAGGGARLFRVRLGPVETREGAEAAASALAAHGFVAQLVAPE